MMRASRPANQRLLAGAAVSGWLLWALPVIADAPQDRFAIGDEIVEDTKTKLAWQRVVPGKTYSANEAARYCAGLELAGRGWRLPSIKELHTLVDETRTLPAIDTRAFPDTPPAFFWTSSQVAGFVMYTWSVNFADGRDAWFTPDRQQHVRCVR